MPLCDPTTTDALKHVGPFKHLYRFESPELPLDAEECEACGTAVIRQGEPQRATAWEPRPGLVPGAKL